MKYRAGFVGLIGQPNSGKSTLLNLLVSEKVSIVNDKPQTTRRRVLGVSSHKSGQIVYVDAPGLVRAQGGLNSFLHQEALDVISQSDVLIGVFSVAEKSKSQVLEILELLRASKKAFVVVITKVDMIAFQHRVRVIKDLAMEVSQTTAVIEISTKWGADKAQVLENIHQQVLALLPESQQPLYDEELYTPHSVKDLAVEIIREKCFENLEQEVPYNLAVRIVKFDESSPKMSKIHADIITTRESHKGIIVGQGAKTIKEIGTQARKEIEKMLGHKVFLKLEVVVRDSWFENKKMMKDLGYVVNKK